MTERQLTIAYKLLKCRDTCRKFYGEAWQTKQDEWKPIIHAVMREQQTSEPLQAAIALGKQLEGFPLTQVWPCSGQQDISGPSRSILAG